MGPSQTIKRYIDSQPDWQRDTLTHARNLIHQTIPEVKEAWKWSVPVFTLNGRLLCALSSFREHIKVNFFEGALLADPHQVFNGGLDSKKHRSLNIRKGETIDTAVMTELLQAAAAHNAL